MPVIMRALDINSKLVRGCEPATAATSVRPVVSAYYFDIRIIFSVSGISLYRPVARHGGVSENDYNIIHGGDKI